MSLTNALANALSGLTANSRAAGAVSSNLANLHTPGFGRREIELASISHGNARGVEVVGITRHVDQGLVSDRRLAGSDLANAQTHAGFFTRLETAVGTPDTATSLTARIAAFEASLVSAASRPDAPERLSAVTARAGELVTKFNSVSDDIQTQRQDAEAQISFAVETLNTALEQVQSLNADILGARRRGGTVAALQDQRQVVIDRISDLIPVRTMARGNGVVALMTPTGAQLLDPEPVTFGFDRANLIVPEMTLASGGLGALEINGTAISTSGDNAPVAGGKLAALFDIRDRHSVAAQSELDALARNMTERFQDPALDATRAVGDPGLFTDRGATFDPLDEIGLSGRLGLNALVDPDSGGAVWRLRDGLGAGVPGATGNADLLLALGDALRADQTLASGALSGGAASLAGHAGVLVSHFGQERLTGEQGASFSAARYFELETMIQEDGVDSDAETQRLLLIEQAYAANARMIQTIDEMMQNLLRI